MGIRNGLGNTDKNRTQCSHSSREIKLCCNTSPSSPAIQGNFKNYSVWEGRQNATARISSEAGSMKCQGMERNFPWQVVLLSVSLARRRLRAPGNPSHPRSGVTNEQPDFISCMVTAAERIWYWVRNMTQFFIPFPHTPRVTPTTLSVSHFTS